MPSAVSPSKTSLANSDIAGTQNGSKHGTPPGSSAHATQTRPVIRTPKLSSNTIQGSTDAAQTLLATGMKSSREILELQNARQDPQIIRATGHL